MATIRHVGYLLEVIFAFYFFETSVLCYPKLMEIFQAVDQI